MTKSENRNRKKKGRDYGVYASLLFKRVSIFCSCKSRSLCQFIVCNYSSSLLIVSHLGNPPLLHELSTFDGDHTP